MGKKSFLSYIKRDSVIHSLTGSTKFLFLVFWSLSSMVTYDTRILIFMFFSSIIFFAFSKIKISEVKSSIYFILFFLILNNLAIFFFSPEHGVNIYGTRHEIAHLFLSYNITLEQLFYSFNVSLKYFVVIPVALLFIITTDPSEFASSLSAIGINYKISYSVALALRYIPDIQRDFSNISKAQQARGISLTKKDKLIDRFKNTATILLPLVLTSIQRIDIISDAMELRGFGKKKKRTWYSSKKFKPLDFIALAFVFFIAFFALFMIIKNGTRYYNPFVAF